MLQAAQNLKNEFSKDHLAFKKKILYLLGKDNIDCRIYAKILVEVLAAYENGVCYRSNLRGVHDPKVIQNKLLRLYEFFKNIDEESLETNLKIFELELASELTEKEIKQNKREHFPEITKPV